jgi:phosphatidylglycerol:prolipoprotein diacylglycerol transferase
MFIQTLDPILITLGPFTIRWYGLFLGIGVLACLGIYHLLAKRDQNRLETIYSLTAWLIIGGLIGARLGHILFYNLPYFIAHPSEIIFINHGGLSSHGLTIGLLFTTWLYHKIKKIDLRDYLDLMVVPIPLLAGCIRMGNFFNSEIIGKVTEVPWGVYFARVDSEPITRHPQQLYEAFTCFVIFGITLFVYKKIQPKKPLLFTFYFFLLTYFTTRFLLEFTKEPHNLEDFFLTTGQMLSVPFIAWSGWWLYKKLQTKRQK